MNEKTLDVSEKLSGDWAALRRREKADYDGVLENASFLLKVVPKGFLRLAPPAIRDAGAPALADVDDFVARAREVSIEAAVRAPCLVRVII